MARVEYEIIEGTEAHVESRMNDLASSDRDVWKIRVEGYQVLRDDDGNLRHSALVCKVTESY